MSVYTTEKRYVLTSPGEAERWIQEKRREMGIFRERCAERAGEMGDENIPVQSFWFKGIVL